MRLFSKCGQIWLILILLALWLYDHGVLATKDEDRSPNQHRSVNSGKPVEILPRRPSQAGTVSITIQSELPNFSKLLESSLIHFPAHDFLDGPRQQRDFWADSAPFVGMSRTSSPYMNIC